MRCSSCGAEKNRGIRGLCQACYKVGRRDGSIQLLYPKGLLCCVSGCRNPVECKGMCNKHYVASRRDGTYERRYDFRRRYRDEWPEEWNDPKVFVGDVGQPPTLKHRLRKKDLTQPLSKGNIHWAPPIATTVSSAEDLDEYHRQSHRLRKHGLTPAQHDALLAKQNGVCAICQLPPTTKWKGSDPALVVDHCHSTGRVRGLLCTTCNTAIGHLRDNPILVGKAMAYLLAEE